MLKAAIQKVLFVTAIKRIPSCIQGGILSFVSHLSNYNSFFECVAVNFLAGVGVNVAFGNAEKDAVGRFYISCFVFVCATNFVMALSDEVGVNDDGFLR